MLGLKWFEMVCRSLLHRPKGGDVGVFDRSFLRIVDKRETILVDEDIFVHRAVIVQPDCFRLGRRADIEEEESRSRIRLGNAEALPACKCSKERLFIIGKQRKGLPTRQGRKLY